MGKPHNTLKRTWKIIFLFVVFNIASYQLWLSFIEQSPFTRFSPNSLPGRYTKSPYLLTDYARYAQDQAGNPIKALELHRKALRNNPLFIPAWIGLCELKYDRGEQQNALKIFSYLNTIASQSSRYRWDKLLLAYQLGELDTLADDLKYIITFQPEKRQQALKLGFLVWPEPMKMLEKIGRENISYLFNYSIQKKKISEAVSLWSTYEPLNHDNKKQLQQFINLLIYDGNIHLAKNIWINHFQHTEGIYNAGFAIKPMQKAFGWRIHNQQGTQWQIITDYKNPQNKLLFIHFTGTENMNYTGLSQIVPLTPNQKYTFSGLVRTLDLTTDQRPFFEVTGLKCKMTRLLTPIFQKNQDWTKYILTFNLPDQCQAVTIRLRRNKSNYLDNQLSGKIWIRNLHIDPIDKNPTLQ